jgi:hypothetical protein
VTRRKSDLVKALEAQSAKTAPEFTQPDVERIVSDATHRAIKSLAEQGLARGPFESMEDWRKRTLAWLKEQSSGWKRFGEHGIEREAEAE